MTKDEALRMALEALEWINRVNAMEYEYQQKAREALNAIYEVLAQPEQEEDWDAVAEKHLAALKKSSKAITEDAAVRAVHKMEQGRGLIDIGRIFTPEKEQSEPPPEFLDALKYDVAKRDSEAQQAYEDAFVNGTGVMLGDKRIDPTSIYKEPERTAVQGEPVAYLNKQGFRVNGDAISPSNYKSMEAWEQAYYDPLYTTPQPAVPERKPLTDEEINKLDQWLFDQPFWRVLALARAIEAAHGITGERK